MKEGVYNMTKTNDRIIKLVVVVMIIALISSFAGCTKKPSTLEEYVNSNEKAKETIEAFSSPESGLEIKIEENTLIYEFKYDVVFSDEEVALISAELEEAIESMPGYGTLKSSLMDETGIDGIIVKLIYLNGDGKEIYSKSY